MAHATGNLPLPEEITKMVKHIIDIPVLDLEERLRLSDWCCIYKAPENLRKVKEEAYTPQCISIGPIHLGKQELEKMQEHKLRYFLFFWKRVSNEQAMNTYKHYLETKEEEVRQCYAEKFPDMAKEKCVDMMLLDAVFIMELFLRNSEWKSPSSGLEYKQTKSFRVRRIDDQILVHSWLSRNITRDLILIENQIPFFVLQKLYDDVVPGDSKKDGHVEDFVDLAIEYFAAFNDTRMSSSHETCRKHYFSGALLRASTSKSKRKYRAGRPRHFTDLIRQLYLPTDLRQDNGWPLHVLRTATATKLRDSGVSFERGAVKRRLIDISFDRTSFLSLFICFGFLKVFKARLSIPQLKVDHTTECLFRNLIAFEQCHFPDKPYFCNYVSFIDSLIHTQLDVELLVEKEVIVHELGSDKEVATLVNSLSKHVVTKSTCYYEMINELNDHYTNKWNHNVAALRLVYFRDLWRASSTVVGIFVLLFAVFQFLAAVRDAFKI